MHVGIIMLQTNFSNYGDCVRPRCTFTISLLSFIRLRLMFITFSVFEMYSRWLE